jgi:electron transfer flavoprotein alpha subunit
VKALVYIEQRQGELNADALGVLSHIAAAHENISAVICGEDGARHIDALAKMGAHHVIVIDAPSLADPLPQAHAAALAALIREQNYDTVLFASSVLTADLAAALAARLEAGLQWGLVSIEERDGKLVGKRLALRDTVLAEVSWTTPVRIALFRPRQFEPVEAAPCSVETQTFAFTEEPHATAAKLVESIATPTTGISLTQAPIIVSGGRGLGKQENLELVRELADAIGGTFGVSLPLVDLGWAPRERQVGQTGTVVKPRLYIACGISGQIQHKLGMEQAGTIVAINTDQDAPIMQFCDLAVQADALKILPELTRLLRERNRH